MGTLTTWCYITDKNIVENLYINITGTSGGDTLSIELTPKREE